MGQKSQPDWLGFWALAAGKPVLNQLRIAVRQAGWPVADSRLRFDRIRFDWDVLLRDGSVKDADFLMVYGREKGKMVLLASGPFEAGLPPYQPK